MNWEQLRAILWLRWRLTKNRFIRGGQLNAVLAVFIIVVLVLGAAGLGVGGVLAGYFAAAEASPRALLIIWDVVVFAFLILWLSGLLVEIQRSESIDLTKLLHLPVTLHQVFFFNYVASHFAPTIVLCLPAMLGLCLGLTLRSGPFMALLVPVVIAFVFMTTAWTYCLRGWLAALMVNKRKRRAIIVWVTITIVLCGQIPNVLFNSHYFRQAKETKRVTKDAVSTDTASATDDSGWPRGFVEGHLAVPPGWVGYSAMSLKDHHPLPAIGAMAASLLLGALGLHRAYRQTLRFYLADETRKEPARVSGQTMRPRGKLLIERHLPWLPDDTAALALATLRSLMRAPELKMAAVMPIVIGAMLMSVHFTNLKGPLPKALPPFAATGVAVLAVFSLGTTMANVFGLDRNGFRTLILLPTRRHHILLAKNLAFFPFTFTIALLLLVTLKILLHLSWILVLAGLLQVTCAFLLFCLMGNFASILVPYRLTQGSLKARQPKPIVFVAVAVSFLLLPVLSLPPMLPASLALLFSSQGWTPWLPVNLLSTLALLAAIGCLYWNLLPFQGRLLQRREQTILREVTEETE
ncbi:MAG: type transport system permease protein [Verrucomicrobiota bacterium]